MKQGKIYLYDQYVGLLTEDETYHKVLLAKTKPTDKGSKKGYFWAVCLLLSRLALFTNWVMLVRAPDVRLMSGGCASVP